MATIIVPRADVTPEQVTRALRAGLALPAAAEALPGILDAARDQDLTVLDALEQLLGTEAAAAERRKLASRLRLAALPAPWTLADYDFSAQPGADEKLIGELATLRFLEEAANILFIGPPGVGKTMLSVALACAAACAGHKVQFTTCEDMTRKLRRAAAEHRFAYGMRTFTAPKLLVIDEVGTGSWTNKPLPAVRGHQRPLPERQHHHHQPCRHRVVGRAARRPPCSPPRPWTGCCTGESSPPSTALPTGCAPTSSAPSPCAPPRPPGPAPGPGHDRRAVALPALRDRLHLDALQPPQAILQPAMPPGLVRHPPPGHRRATPR
jgi:IstB-like ATP binding protein